MYLRGSAKLLGELGDYEEHGLVEGGRPSSLQQHVFSDSLILNQPCTFDWRINTSCAS
jgi:hypothetical protein